MTPLQIDNAARTKVKATGYLVHYDNLHETPTGLYIVASVIHGDARQVSIGQRARYRTDGVISLTIVGKVNIGDAETMEVASAIAMIFRGVSEGGLSYRVPRITKLGRVSGRWQINVTCPWYADDQEA